MDIFLAGGVTGNLYPFWNSLAEQGDSDEAMRIFLAGQAPWSETGLYDNAIINQKPFILESYYYLDGKINRLIKYFGDFLLDSGAFTFREANKSNVNWEEYTVNYGKFVKENNIEKYFEMDIDSLVGYDEVLRLRKILEDTAERKCIPVWHINRGKEDFIETCINYPYVALGGIAGMSKGCEAYKRYQQAFPWFIEQAHKNNAKIHGLGFTSMEGLKRYHFDSVDSTAWTTGNRFGYIYKFNGKTITKINVPSGMRLGDTRKVALINFTEWLKFQKYAINHL